MNNLSEKFKYLLNNFYILKTQGGGSYGVVYKVRRLDDQIIYAAKKV